MSAGRAQTHDILDVSFLVRPGSQDGGVTRTARTSPVFSVNGDDLLAVLIQASRGHADYMGCFIAGFASHNATQRARLSTELPPVTAGGRYLLYVCPECGDLGCGAYAVKIRMTADTVEWYDFAFENGYEPAHILSEVGPFRFDRSQYDEVLTKASAS